jgi:hypothetical protein
MNKLFLYVIFLSAVGLATMGPAYNAAPALDLYPGNCVVLYNAEQPLSGAFSQQFHFPASQTYSPGPPAVSFELIWAANPGAFNIQIQDADTDSTGNYVTLPAAGTVTSTPQTAGGTYTSRVELNPWRANYGRLYVQTQSANAVNLTAKACR